MFDPFSLLNDEFWNRLAERPLFKLVDCAIFLLIFFYIVALRNPRRIPAQNLAPWPLVFVSGVLVALQTLRGSQGRAELAAAVVLIAGISVSYLLAERQRRPLAGPPTSGPPASNPPPASPPASPPPPASPSGSPGDTGPAPRLLVTASVTVGGKTHTAIVPPFREDSVTPMLASGLQRGDRAIVVDAPGVDYLARLRSPSRVDVVLCPLDRHGVRWHFWGEIRVEGDIASLAHAAIPDCPCPEPERPDARIFLAEITRHCFQTGCHDDAELLRRVRTAPLSELRPMLTGTPAEHLLALKPDQFQPIRSLAGSALALLAITRDQAGPAFSMRPWVRAGGHGAVFIGGKPPGRKRLGAPLAVLARLAILESLTFPEGDQRLWLCLDGLDTPALGRIEGLEHDLPALGRRGVRCMLGFESVTRLSVIYGRKAAERISASCGNSLILPGGEDA